MRSAGVPAWKPFDQYVVSTTPVSDSAQTGSAASGSTWKVSLVGPPSQPIESQPRSAGASRSRIPGDNATTGVGGAARSSSPEIRKLDAGARPQPPRTMHGQGD